MPRAPKPIAVKMFDEPDHKPELLVQKVYEMTRDGGWSEDNPYLGSSESVQYHNPKCVVPSHQPWAIEMFGPERLDRDYWDGSGCRFA